MKYIIICPIYPPEPIVSAFTSSQIAEKLRASDHKVTVITSFPNRPGGKVYDGYKRKLFQAQIQENGIKIFRCFSTLSRSSTIPSRFLENLSFAFTSGICLLFSPKPDLVYSNSWPIFSTGLMALICRIRHIPYIISVQDIYPETLLNQGRIKSDGAIYSFLLKVDQWIVNGSRKTILISEEFAQVYKSTRKIDDDKIAVIPNWIDINRINPISPDLYRNERDIQTNRFVLLYGGNIGVASGILEFLTNLKSITFRTNISFVIAGSGSQLKACQKAGKEIRNIEVLFHSPWKEEDTSKVLSAADLLILPTYGVQSLFSVPSKLISYMLSSRPILALTDPNSSIAKTIKKADCGWVIDPANDTEIIEKIIEISTYRKNELNKKGNNGRIFALQNFADDVCLPQIMKVITGSLDE